MPSVEVKASPRGVPGAVSDPTRISGEELTFAGAGEVPVNGYLAGGFIDRATPDERSTPMRPTPPLELAARLSCPLLAAVGAEDHNPSPQLAEQLRERTGASGQEVKVDVYDGAGHAFFADYRPTYRAEPAAKLWSEVVPFLHRHLQAD
jgi:dienelactone hydrolase